MSSFVRGRLRGQSGEQVSPLPDEARRRDCFVRRSRGHVAEKVPYPYADAQTLNAEGCRCAGRGASRSFAEVPWLGILDANPCERQHIEGRREW